MLAIYVVAILLVCFLVDCSVTYFIIGMDNFLLCFCFISVRKSAFDVFVSADNVIYHICWFIVSATMPRDDSAILCARDRPFLRRCR